MGVRLRRTGVQRLLWALMGLMLFACGDESVEEPQESEVELPPIRTTPTEEREPCADRNPLRNAYFGDTHIHTSLSFDAWVYDVRLDPEAAYRFARGEKVYGPPLGADGVGTRPLQLARPLDFVALSDHAEMLAEVNTCTTPGNAAYDSAACQKYREGGASSIVQFGISLTEPQPIRIEEICGEQGVDCPALSRDVWSSIQEAAEEAYDRTSACSFTSFVAYEYSGAPEVSNIHRNVIFRNEKVPVAPTSYFEEPTPQGLWARLQEECLDAGTGCDVLAIPHNSNWSNGRQFQVTYPGATTRDEQASAAAFRARIEPLVEIFQHKGDSECRNGLETVLGTPDELCGFEKLRQEADDCGDGIGGGAMIGLGCVSRLDFVRNVLKEGLKQEAELGANPFKLGIIAATDSHSGTPGRVPEDASTGHLGNADDDPTEQLGVGFAFPGGIIYNGGGLAGVWAEENSRDALFEAMRRRETFGTSGPRIVVRFFGGWDYPDGMCEDPQLVARGYAGGTPMGGDLPPRGEASAPRFVVQALRDSADGATPLQRAQIIKGWMDGEGKLREKVWDVAGDKNNGASVDTNTCERSGSGADLLCSVWSDPEFDPAQRAFYYVRVVENPTCRWSTHVCNQLPEAERPDSCTDPAYPRVIQERAWTSPIWYTPPGP